MLFQKYILSEDYTFQKYTVNDTVEVLLSSGIFPTGVLSVTELGIYTLSFIQFVDEFAPTNDFFIQINQTAFTISQFLFNYDALAHPNFIIDGFKLYSSQAVYDFVNQIPTIPTTSLPSLNGNGCEFLDTAQVKVVGRSIVYTVSRSYMALVSDNNYTALYDCVSFSGETLTVPEALLTRYIAPVTTP